MARPLAVAVGFIGKLPLAGMSLANLHEITGLQELGYKVHYVERLNTPNQCYDPSSNATTDDPSYALKYLDDLLPRFGIQRDSYSFIDRENRCHGSGWAALRAVLRRAAFVLTMGDPTWFDELELCPRRAFVDADPLFTQVELLEGRDRVSALSHYNTLFTYGVRMGEKDCTIPSAGRMWLPARMAVATKFWNPTPAAAHLPITTLMNWTSGRDVVHDGRIYGYKNREFERFIDLPRRTPKALAVAVGGNAPRDRLRNHGWRLLDPLDTTLTLEAYHAFIAGSRADFGIAKHAYVASRSGWFSDRSTCYLARGRPVLHQDTGFGDWLPTGEGVFSFSDLDEVLEALDRLDTDYERHARAARGIAEEYFEASKVIGRMLDDAGFR
jgi:hypothetical protein